MKYSRSGQTLDEIVFKKRRSLSERESARYGPETQGAASTMLCQVAERSARTCAPRARRLWAALGGSGRLGTRGGSADPARASRLQGRRSHPPPLSLLLRTTPGTRRADTTATTATLETARPPGAPWRSAVAALWPWRPRLASAVPAARRGVCDPCSMVRPQTDGVERVDKHKEAWPHVQWLCVLLPCTE